MTPERDMPTVDRRNSPKLADIILLYITITGEMGAMEQVLVTWLG